MSAAASMFAFLSRWIDDAAAGLARLSAMLRRGRRIELTEQADGFFLGGRMEQRGGRTARRNGRSASSRTGSPNQSRRE